MFKYLGETVTNSNGICEEIKRRMYMGNAYYYTFENILSSRLLSKKLKVCVFQCQPTALLRASGSTQGG